MSKELAKQLLARGNALDGARAPWDSLWQELADVVHPRRGMITRRGAQGTTPDRTKLAEAFDGTAARANRTLADGQFARITPMGARWFACKPPQALERNSEALAWYHACSEKIISSLYASNFYSVAKEHYLDRGAFGTAATEVTGGRGGKGIHFRSFAVGSYSVAEDEFGVVSTLFRKYQWSADQIVRAFGEANCPADILKRAKDPAQRQELVELRHCVYPRDERDPRKIDGANKPFASVHILPDGEHILANTGYDEFPCPVSRWETWGDSPYGWAPAYLALPEATQANYLEQMLDTAVETTVFPRVLYGSSLKGDIDFRAMGLTCYDPTAGEAPKEWLTAGRYDVGKDRARDKRQAINEAFFVPLFNAISQLDKDATATEVQALVSESRELFHPIFAGLSREFLVPVLRRCFSILLRQGELPPPPPSVIQRDNLGAFIADPDVEFVSSMALALEQSNLMNFNQVLQVLLPIGQSDPSVFDFIDTDQVGPSLFRAKGLPSAWVREPQAIDAIRQGRAQAAQAAAAEQASGAVQKLGGAPGISQLSTLAQAG